MSKIHQSLHYEAINSALADCGYNTYSQFGEDGLIDKALTLAGETNRWCFEVGAADGVFYSNTLRLRERGWSAVLVESSDKDASLLMRHASDCVHVVHEQADDMDAILARCGAPVGLDLGVIDIDGQDYWLWHDMQQYRPRVMLVEFHWADGDDFIPDRGAGYRKQAGESAMIRLGSDKGYTPVAKTHVNLLFIRDDCMW